MPTSQKVIDRANAAWSEDPPYSHLQTRVASARSSDAVKTRAWGKIWPGDPVPGVDPGPPGPTPGILFTQSLTFKEVDDFGTMYHDYLNEMDGDLLIDLGIVLIRTQAGPPPLMVVGFKDVAARTAFNQGNNLLVWSLDGIDLTTATGWQNDNIEGHPAIIDLTSSVPTGLGPYDMKWQSPAAKVAAAKKRVKR